LKTDKVFENASEILEFYQPVSNIARENDKFAASDFEL